MGQVVACGGCSVPAREWSGVVVTTCLGGEDPSTHAMASCVLDMPTVELGNFGHGDDLDVEARGKPLQELGLAEAATAASRPREVMRQKQNSRAGRGGHRRNVNLSCCGTGAAHSPSPSGAATLTAPVREGGW
jgi:hypothetical protein